MAHNNRYPLRRRNNNRYHHEVDGMAHNNEQALVPVPVAPAQVLMTPRLTVYLYTITEPYLLCVRTLPPEQDHLIKGDAFVKNVEVATTNEEIHWMDNFLTTNEITLASTPHGLSVIVIDKYENVWVLRLEKRVDNSYILTGESFDRFKIRQRFTPGWIFHLWVARGHTGQVIMSVDFIMRNRRRN